MDSIAHVMHVLWKTLDLLNANRSENVADQSGMRYEILQLGLKRLFEEQILTKAQVKQVLDYAKRTIFAHLQLYLACMARNKQATRVKRVEIFTETPQVCETADLESECREVLEDGRAATPEELVAGCSDPLLIQIQWCTTGPSHPQTSAAEILGRGLWKSSN